MEQASIMVMTFGIRTHIAIIDPIIPEVGDISATDTALAMDIAHTTQDMVTGTDTTRVTIMAITMDCIMPIITTTAKMKTPGTMAREMVSALPMA